MAGLRLPDPGHGWELGRAQLNGGFIAEGSGNDEFALTYYNEGELGFIHPAGKDFTRLRPLLLLSARARPGPTATTSGRRSRAARSNNSPPVATPATSGRRSSTGRCEQPGKRPGRRAAHRPLLQLRPALLGGLGCARRSLDPADRRVLRGLRGRDAPQHHDRRPALPRRRRRRRALGRRASPRRRPPRTRPSCPTSPTPSWTRPTTSAARCSSSTTSGAGSSTMSRPPSVPDDRQSTDLERGLRPDGLPDPGGRDLALRPEDAAPSRARVDHTQLGHESILKLISYRFGLGTLARGTRWRTTSARASTGRHRLRAARAARPEHGRLDPVRPRRRPGRSPPAREAHQSDLAELEGFAERHGFAVGDGNPEAIFRDPDSVKQAHELGNTLP